MVDIDVSVVVKNRPLENWLLASPEALKKLSGQFEVTEGFRKRVAPDKADSVTSPERELNRIAKGKAEYHKHKDAVQVLKNADPEEMATNSRSF